MPFCINCGAQNQESSRFCVTCGQVLYQEPKNSEPQYKRKWPAALPISLIAALGLAALLIASLRNRKESVTDSTSHQAPDDLPINDGAVLTIVGADRHGAALSQGSGFIISTDGLAVTNYHVLKDVSQAAVECCGGRQLELHAIEGADFAKDLVIFQLSYSNGEKPRDLPYLTVGSSANLAVGQKIIVIGSPQGLENTVSDGILSGIREYDSVSYLQITAPISPGSSGGPVLDNRGNVIGIATFQLKKGQNLNFAVSSQYIDSIRKEHFELSLPQFRSAVAEVEREEHEKERRQSAQGVSRSTQPVQSALTGEFRGTVHNITSDISAQFAILVEDTEGSLSGCMGVVKPLYGSGPLQGSETGPDVSFVVTSPIGKITFTGHSEQGSIYGWYDVQHPDASTELGTFSLQKHDSKGPGVNFDISNCPTDTDMNK